MKKVVLMMFGLLLISNGFSQNQAKYSQLVSEAWGLYGKKEYLKSGEKYSDAFMSMGNKGTNYDRYNAACSWALAGEIDSSFVQLFRISRAGNYANYNHITVDTDLNTLHSDSRWDEVILLVKANKDKAEENLDKPLVAVLDSIYNEDQSYRLKTRDVTEKYGRDSDEYRLLWDTIRMKDSTNLLFVTNLIDERGWLGSDVIGQQGNSTLFLVIQHSNKKTWEKYLPLLREAVKKGNAKGDQLALMEDRSALAHGELQIYGSQLTSIPGQEGYVVEPMIDPDNVDKRRAEVGLGTMLDYLAYWNLTWDVEEYKKNLPELEKKLKQWER